MYSVISIVLEHHQDLYLRNPPTLVRGQANTNLEVSKT